MPPEEGGGARLHPVGLAQGFDEVAAFGVVEVALEGESLREFSRLATLHSS